MDLWVEQYSSARGSQRTKARDCDDDVLDYPSSGRNGRRAPGCKGGARS
jgi:hypothetical protein